MILKIHTNFEYSNKCHELIKEQCLKDSLLFCLINDNMIF